MYSHGREFVNVRFTKDCVWDISVEALVTPIIKIVLIVHTKEDHCFMIVGPVCNLRVMEAVAE
jgi:hypothetical protein